MRQFKPQKVTNMAWALAKASQADAKLFAVTTGAAQRRMGQSKPQKFANAAWALAIASQASAKLFIVTAMEVQRQMSEFKGQTPAKKVVQRVDVTTQHMQACRSL